jgi:Proteasome subunit
MEIDEHIGCAMSGLIADARTLVEHARVETQVPNLSYCLALIKLLLLQFILVYCFCCEVYSSLRFIYFSVLRSTV